MKKILFVLSMAIAVIGASGQNSQWSYDFGTATAAHYTSTTYSNTYLPAPAALGGNASVRASSATEGPVELVAAGMAGGAGAELKMTSGSTASGAKFGLGAYSGATVGMFQCRINIASGSNGRFILYLGNGANFTSGSGINVAQTFASLRFSPGASGVNIDWLLSSASPNYTTAGLTQTSISTNQSYRLQFFMNNGNAGTSYTTGSGASQATNSLAAGTFDIWLNDTKILVNADPSTGTLPQGTIINAMNFLNVGAGSSTPVVYLDDINYANFLPSNIPPATVSAIDSIKNKYYNWLTDGGADYSNSQVLDRYNRFISSGLAARNLAGYDFANPGAAWNFNNDADKEQYFNLVEQKLIRLVFLYQLRGPAGTPNPNFHSPTLKDTIINIFNYMKARGINGNTDFAYVIVPSTEEVITSGNGVAIRSSAYTTAVLLMKEELKAAGEFANHLAAMQTLTYFMDPGYPYFNFTNPGYNTDVIRSSIQQRFCYILAQDDTSSTRMANMDFLKRFINNAFRISNGWNDCIKPDFITFHHRGVYANTYGENALHQGAILNLMLKGSSYELDATAKANLKQAILTYNKFSKGFEMPGSLGGRFPFVTDAINDLRPALAYLYLADPVANNDAGREFMRLWAISASANTELQRANTVSIALVNTLGGIQNMADLLNMGLTALPERMEGQFNFPYAGLSVHKYNGNQVSIKGTSKHIWHYENGTGENIFGRYSSAGSMEILSTGNPLTHATNGYVENGWDWSRTPGVTAAYLPLSVLGTGTHREFNGRNMLAHASLDSNGVFAMDYRDYNSATTMTALKSAFFFKDKILCLGSNISNPGGTYPIQTTLFQTALPDANTPTYVNANAATGTSYSVSQTGGGLWATDASGNGYVLPANAANFETVTIQRSVQNSRDNSNTNNTSGSFVTAYIDHGIAPASTSKYAYGVMLQGGQAGTQQFANGFATYFKIWQHNSAAHIAQYLPDSVFAYAIFNAATEFAYDVVKRVDKPAVVMTQKTDNNNRLKISLTNPSLGLLASNESYTWSQISSNNAILNRAPQTEIVKLTIRGNWTLETPAPNVSATIVDDSTQLSFSTINGQTIQVQLQKTMLLPLDLRLFATPNNTDGQLLNWVYSEDGRQVKNFILEKSTNASAWNTDAKLGAGEKNYTFNPAGAVYVRLVIIHTDGSRLVSNIIKLAGKNDGPAGSISVSPNPATNHVTIKSKGGTITIQQIFNSAGANVTSLVNIRSTANTAMLDTDHLAKGIYWVEVEESNGKRVVKFIKQ